MKTPKWVTRTIAWTRRHWVLSTALVFVLIGIGYWLYQANRPVEYQFVTVTRGSITETVSVTGSTEAVQNVSLAFQGSGMIARVYRDVGDRVSAGEVLASLNTASLQAALEEAQAAYDSAVASRGATSATETETAARNAYQSAFTTLDTTLHDEVDTFFGDGTAYGPELLITAPGYDFGELSRERARITARMREYQASLPGASVQDPLTLLNQANTIASDISNFLNKLSVAANDSSSGATATQLAALTSARSTVSTLLGTLSTARNTFRSGNANSTAIANANVNQAAARVAAARANLANAQIVAPFTGLVTQFDAKVGQTAVAGTPLISLISSGGFQIIAGVSETDIGKVAVGNTVSMTLDAFPNETFIGTVFYIDPAETVIDGVVDYKIKVSFDKADPRMKSGLTVNLDLMTRRKDDVLLLPQYAILEDDEGSYVKMVATTTPVRVPVMRGIQDEKGIVEIRSGVQEGDRVLNVGLKQ